MRIEKFIETREYINSTGLFSVRGDFGAVNTSNGFVCQKNGKETTYSYQDEKVRLTATFLELDNGVILRKDSLTNLTDKEMEINKLCSRFAMDSNAYEVYSQYSGWQHENIGEWQKLVNQITVETQGIRPCDGATPMVALHNLYNGKNTVFHLLPNCQWKINVKKFPYSDKEIVLVEMGFSDSALRLKVSAKETINLPEIIFYQAQSKTDLDAYKLHRVFNDLYPRKTLPVIYNSWLYCFDILDIDALKKQVDTAKELGFEAFMIDAGWFGEGEVWFTCVGDWEENMTSGPKGRLKELSDYVREKGLTFGIWLEPERAGKDSKALKEHPEYYIDNTLLDFANPKAREFVMEKVVKVMDKYNVGWVKLDYNATTPFDPSNQAFYRYWQGYWQFIKDFKAKYPNVYLTGCGGGGFRLDLEQAKFFDSFWFTDNQGPYDGIRILKDALKRMPTCTIDRWNVQTYCTGFPEFGNPKTVGKMISCNNATWEFLIGVPDSFVEEFMKGGPMGFSCDIASFPQEYKEKWKNVIAKYKEDREFYRTAEARILVDSECIIAIEYSNKEFDKAIIQVFTKNVYANDLTVYPVVDFDAEYLLNGDTVSGKELKEEGIFVKELVNNTCRVFELIKK